MVEKTQALIFLVSPLILLMVAFLSIFKGAMNLRRVKKLGLISMVIGIFTSIIGMVLVYQQGTLVSPLLVWNDLGFSIKIDVLGIILFGMISIIGFVVLKYSNNYLDGDQSQSQFIGRLSITYASVLLFVLSGNIFMMFLCWVSMSFALNKLLLFYSERKKAVIAARKKFYVARIGDFFLLTAFIFLYKTFGTGDIQSMVYQIKEGSNFSMVYLNIAAVFLGLAAIMKSAQFPFHGWLVEVMETPTPVSATLHAGLINAGPFLMISMSHILNISSSASIMLIIVGSISAIIGAIAFMTQPAQKTALAYSSIAHMGFSLLTSGLGLYAASALHLVAHSFYKGHSFLSSGTAVETLKLKKVLTPKRSGSIPRIVLSVGISMGLFISSAYLWNVDYKSDYAFLAISTVLLVAVTLFLTSSIDAKNYAKTIIKSTLFSFVIFNTFLALETGAHYILAAQIPESTQLTGTKLHVVIALFSIFIFIASLQIISPLIPKTGFTKSLGIHFRNGLYVNAYADKWMGAFKKNSIKEVEDKKSVNYVSGKLAKISA